MPQPRQVRRQRADPLPVGGAGVSRSLGLEPGVVVRQLLATSPTRSATLSDEISRAEVLAAYLTHATRYYVDAEGQPTKELDNMKSAITPVRELYAETPAAAFGPKALAAVRQYVVGLGWCRTLINHQLDRVRRAIKWAASEELIPVTTYEGLRTLAGLRRGRTDARESDPVKPVADEVVRATCPSSRTTSGSLSS